ncbi:MAG: transporter [Saprospiraceae bacterium]|nr:transporter [Saprospiraceae bacterium]
MKYLKLWAPAIALALSLNLSAQTPSDAIYMDKGQICLAALYTHDTWDEYWEGTLKRDNGNIGTLTRQTVMPMFALGITERINVIAGLPWVRTSASAGQMTGVSGIQDAGLWIKAKALEFKSGESALTLHATAGLTVPASNYLADYMPFSLGLGCVDGSLRAIVQYQWKGWYARAQSGYHLRGNTTIERDYYYTTQDYYTDEVDMPNALDYGAALGWWNPAGTLKAELLMDGLQTLGGFDIRRQDAPFPSNKMNFTRLGAGVQYYPLSGTGLGIIASGGYVVAGRNMGQSLVLTGGVTYQFNIWH